MNDMLRFKSASPFHIPGYWDIELRRFEGMFVYPNNACDIKSHTFFDGIEWTQLHLQTPPLSRESETKRIHVILSTWESLTQMRA